MAPGMPSVFDDQGFYQGPLQTDVKQTVQLDWTIMVVKFTTAGTEQWPSSFLQVGCTQKS